MRCLMFGKFGRLPVALALMVGLLTLGLTRNEGASARPVPIIPPDGVIRGPARVVDGDTIDIGGIRIRLEGIDAPEAGQTCSTAAGAPWECGTEATRTMVQLTRGQDLACVSHSLDTYGRVLATCYAGNTDIEAEMVRRGMAWAFVRYSQTYVADEATARNAHVGIWQGAAQPAWEYRAARWASAVTAAPVSYGGASIAGAGAASGCVIKGNVSHSGLVYHMPWSRWYDKVTMDTSKGKRWFCSEAEAQAAGWRPAMMR